jgi:cation transport ATPase
MNLPQTFPIEGMSCSSCAAKIQKRLLEHPDITEAEVTFSPSQARIVISSPLSEEAMNQWLQPLEKYRVRSEAVVSVSSPLPAKSAQTYRPLIILLIYLLLVTAVAASTLDLREVMRLFMGGFFIAFSFFKMLDLRGFRDAYRSYDLVAKAVPAYGFIYPFIELALGLAYIAAWQPMLVNAVTALVMAVSLAGVLRAVLSKQTIRCACLGTVFNLPMSTVTIVEDGLMLGMAVIALVLPH